MLKSLKLKNFQCHRDLTVEFAPGVNVIAGTSDVGKSAVLKALLWVLTNKPQGLAFRSWGCGKDESVSVEAALDDKTVTRTRSEKINDYLLKAEDGTDTRFMAMRTDVPVDLAAFFNLAPVNIQTQFQPHWLLSASSAEVARVFNDACALSVIDKTIKRIGEIGSKARAVAYANQQDAARMREEYAKLAWVDEAMKLLLSAQAEHARIQEREESLSALTDYLAGTEEINAELAATEADLANLTGLDDLAVQSREIAARQEGVADLSAIVSELADINRKDKENNLLPDDALREAAKQYASAAELDKLLDDLEVLCADLPHFDEKLEAMQSEMQNLEQEIAAIWESLDLCPLCGQPLEEKHHEGGLE